MTANGMQTAKSPMTKPSIPSLQRGEILLVIHPQVSSELKLYNSFFIKRFFFSCFSNLLSIGALDALLLPNDESIGFEYEVLELLFCDTNVEFIFLGLVIVRSGDTRLNEFEVNGAGAQGIELDRAIRLSKRGDTDVRSAVGGPICGSCNGGESLNFPLNPSLSY